MENVPVSLQTAIGRSLELTKENERLYLSVCFNYGGRDDIVRAVRKMMDEGMKPEEVTEETLSQHLFTCNLPDPDLIIRTAGEMRLSNFLIWQAAYSEYYSTPTFWPDFGRESLYEALMEYSHRKRKFGGILPEEYDEYMGESGATKDDGRRTTLTLSGKAAEGADDSVEDEAAPRPDPAAVS
jgi:undecaprenyl diphosphate synthase